MKWIKEHSHRILLSSLALITAFALVFSGLNLTVQSTGTIGYGKNLLTVGSKQVVLTIGTASATGATDYTVNGLNDSATFQTAMNALPATGGKLEVLGGTYIFTATVTRAINNITIEGVGQGTIFTYNGVNPIFTAGGNNWVMANFDTDAGDVSFGATTGWVRENVNGNSYSTTGSVTLNSSNLLFATADVSNVGSTSGEVANIYIGNAGRLYFGLAQDASLWRYGAGVLSIGTNALHYGTSANNTLNHQFVWHDNTYLSLKDGGNDWNAGLILSELRIRSDGTDATNNPGQLQSDERYSSDLSVNAMGAAGALTEVLRFVGSTGFGVEPYIRLYKVIQANGQAITGIDYISLSNGEAIRGTLDNATVVIEGGTDGNSARIDLYGKNAGGTPGLFWVRTPNAALAATDRLQISGGVNTASVTWANSNQYGLILGNALNANGQAITSAIYVSNPAPTELTIAADTITVTQSQHRVDTEADAATDNVSTINGGVDGMMVTFRSEDATRDVVFINGTGNISNGADRTLTDPVDSITLRWESTIARWVLISFADNG